MICWNLFHHNPPFNGLFEKFKSGSRVNTTKPKLYRAARDEIWGIYLWLYNRIISSGRISILTNSFFLTAITSTLLHNRGYAKHHVSLMEEYFSAFFPFASWCLLLFTVFALHFLTSNAFTILTTGRWTIVMVARMKNIPKIINLHFISPFFRYPHSFTLHLIFIHISHNSTIMCTVVNQPHPILLWITQIWLLIQLLCIFFNNITKLSHHLYGNMRLNGANYTKPDRWQKRCNSHLCKPLIAN